MTTLEPGQVGARLAPLASPLAAALGDDEARRTWLVGGVVRDALLGRGLPDLDLVVDGDAEPVARRLASALGGTPFPLGERFGCWRVALADDGQHIDVCAARGASLEDDLGLRDFTINAMAAPLADPGQLVDPLGGHADLTAGLLRMVRAEAFDDDPLRMLRAARIAHLLGLDLDPGTEDAIRARAALVVEPSGERIFAELVQLMESTEARRGLRLLDRLGLLEHLLPELHACKGLEQSRYHHLDVYEHTLAVLDNCEDILADPEHYLGVGDPIPDVPFDAEADRIVRFAALCHDLGKPATHQVHNGRVSFIGHDSVGCESVDAMCDRWAASNEFRDSVKVLVRTHLALGMLLHAPLGAREKYRYLRAVEPRGAEAIVLSLADRLATAGPDDRRSWVRKHHATARALWHAHWTERRDGRPVPLLDGVEIIEAAGIDPGPAVGKLVAALAEEQAAGTVTTRDEAIAFVAASCR